MPVPQADVRHVGHANVVAVRSLFENGHQPARSRQSSTEIRASHCFIFYVGCLFHFYHYYDKYCYGTTTVLLLVRVYFILKYYSTPELLEPVL